MYQDMCMYLITPGVCTLLLNAPQPTQWPTVLLILCIMHSVYCIWAIQPVHCDSPFTYTRCIYIYVPRGWGGGGYVGKIKKRGRKDFFGIIYASSVFVKKLDTLYCTCSMPKTVDFSTLLNSFNSIFTVSRATPFVKQNSKRFEEQWPFLWNPFKSWKCEKNYNKKGILI